VSQWKNHGIKFGYWDFFKKEAYAEGFKAATLASPDKPDAKEEERRRVIGIIAAIRENASIQEIIDLISKDD
jgi:hypothetical protein